MHSFPSAFLALAALAVATSSVMAQQQGTELATGARVRLTSPTLKNQQVVRIVSVGSDTVVFRSDATPETRRLALRDISVVETSLGERRRTGRGAVIGLLAGAVIGGIAGYQAHDACDDAFPTALTGCLSPVGAGGSAAILGVVGGAAGLLIGSSIGWLAKSEKWQRVPFNGRSASVVPSHGGVLVTVSRPF